MTTYPEKCRKAAQYLSDDYILSNYEMSSVTRECHIINSDTKKPKLLIILTRPHMIRWPINDKTQKHNIYDEEYKEELKKKISEDQTFLAAYTVPNKLGVSEQDCKVDYQRDGGKIYKEQNFGKNDNQFAQGISISVKAEVPIDKIDEDIVDRVVSIGEDVEKICSSWRSVYFAQITKSGPFKIEISFGKELGNAFGLLQDLRVKAADSIEEIRKEISSIDGSFDKDAFLERFFPTTPKDQNIDDNVLSINFRNINYDSEGDVIDDPNYKLRDDSSDDFSDESVKSAKIFAAILEHIKLREEKAKIAEKIPKFLEFLRQNGFEAETAEMEYYKGSPAIVAHLEVQKDKNQTDEFQNSLDNKLNIKKDENKRQFLPIVFFISPNKLYIYFFETRSKNPSYKPEISSTKIDAETLGDIMDQLTNNPERYRKNEQNRGWDGRNR